RRCGVPHDDIANDGRPGPLRPRAARGGLATGPGRQSRQGIHRRQERHRPAAKNGPIADAGQRRRDRNAGGVLRPGRFLAQQESQQVGWAVPTTVKNEGGRSPPYFLTSGFFVPHSWARCSLSSRICCFSFSVNSPVFLGTFVVGGPPQPAATSRPATTAI